MELLKNRVGKYHVSLDIIDEFEETILYDPSMFPAKKFNSLITRSSSFIWKLLEKFNSFYDFNTHSNSKKTQQGKKLLFAILMGTKFDQCLPHFAFSYNKNFYMFDAWPSKHEKLIWFINLFNVNKAFFSSSQVVDIIQSKLNDTKCYWIPEGIRPELYKHYKYSEKDIDVLAMGRKYEAYHDRIVSDLHDKGNVYLYEKEKGKIIFPTREEFVDGMARTKISVCFPSNITHPERAGNIETMTNRYLQSMVSKCIIVGQAPKEMITLFGYNPVIEYDQKDPTGQLQSIIKNYYDYIPLIEKNYIKVVQEHTWLNRWDQIKNILNLGESRLIDYKAETKQFQNS